MFSVPIWSTFKQVVRMRSTVNAILSYVFFRCFRNRFIIISQTSKKMATFPLNISTINLQIPLLFLLSGSCVIFFLLHLACYLFACFVCFFTWTIHLHQFAGTRRKTTIFNLNSFFIWFYFYLFRRETVGVHWWCNDRTVDGNWLVRCRTASNVRLRIYQAFICERHTISRG